MGMHRSRESEAEFYVRDTGIGIHPDDIEKVFYMFRRGRNCTALGMAGKAWACARVKSIIETYSGSIWVESRFGNGSHIPVHDQRAYVPELQQNQMTCRPNVEFA